MKTKYQIRRITPVALFLGLVAWLLAGCSLLGLLAPTEIPAVNPAVATTENLVISTATETPTPPPLVISQVYMQVEVPAHNTGEANVECPPGFVVLSGGYATNPTMPVYTSTVYGNGWDVFGENTSDAPLPLNAYAVCLETLSATSEVIFQQGNLPANGSGSVHAICPEGSIVTGGGYASSLVTLPVTSMKEENGWTVTSMNKTSSEAPLSVYAVCLSGINGATSTMYTQTALVANQAGVTGASCSAGSDIVGGGFASGGTSIIFNTSLDEGAKQWMVFAQDLGAGDLINSYAICLAQQ